MYIYKSHVFAYWVAALEINLLPKFPNMGVLVVRLILILCLSFLSLTNDSQLLNFEIFI